MGFVKGFIKSRKMDEAEIFSANQLKPPKYYIDTGSYTLNAAISGSIFKGIPSNSVIAFAGDPATGKTFFAIESIGNLLRKEPTAEAVYFESEKAIKEGMLEARGIDDTRLYIDEVSTVQQFRTHATQMLEDYKAIPEKDRIPLAFVLDSLGNLSTTKEMEDTSDGKETKDMTRAQLVKGTFRVITLKSGQLNVPIIITNHTYDEMGVMYPTKQMSGGSGLKYCASSIIFLSKSKDKDSDGDVIGNIVNIRMGKSRDTKEGTFVKSRLNFEQGLDRYYGLVDIAIEAEVFKKNGKKIVVTDEATGEIKEVFESRIVKNPEQFFTDSVLKKIDAWIQENFKYGAGERPESTDEDDSE